MFFQRIKLKVRNLYKKVHDLFENNIKSTSFAWSTCLEAIQFLTSMLWSIAAPQIGQFLLFFMYSHLQPPHTQEWKQGTNNTEHLRSRQTTHFDESGGLDCRSFCRFFCRLPCGGSSSSLSQTYRAVPNPITRTPAKTKPQIAIIQTVVYSRKLEVEMHGKVKIEAAQLIYVDMSWDICSLNQLVVGWFD